MGGRLRRRAGGGEGRRRMDWRRIGYGRLRRRCQTLRVPTLPSLRATVSQTRMRPLFKDHEPDLDTDADTDADVDVDEGFWLGEYGRSHAHDDEHVTFVPPGVSGVVPILPGEWRWW
jgi:hypothetical protein